MNNHPPLPPIHRPTTTQILHQTTAVLFTRNQLLHFLILSFILLNFRTRMENTADFLITLTDNDPSFKSLFPPKPINHFHHHHFTREDEFFIVNKDINHRFFDKSFTTKPQSNSTPITLDTFNEQFGYSTSILSFKPVESNNSTDSVDFVSVNDSTELHAFGEFAFAFAYMCLLYVLSQSLIHGIIFVLVVNHIRNKRNRFMNTYRRGMILGLRRLSWLFLLRYFLMDLLFQILSVWFVRCEDRYSLFKILVRLKFLPFSIGFSSVIIWVKGFEKEIFGFLLSYVSLDMIISCVFGVCVGEVMANPRRTYRRVLRELCRLLSLWIYPAILLKLLENIVSSAFAKFVLSQVFEEFLGSFIQSLMMIYLMVAWMVYYFSVRSMDANARGVRQLRVMLNNNLR